MLQYSDFYFVQYLHVCPPLNAIFRFLFCATFACLSPVNCNALSVHPFVCSSDGHTFVVSAHFRTNSSRDWSQTWWIYSLYYSLGLINFCSRSAEFSPVASRWLIEQFPHIGRQTADLIELKFGVEKYIILNLANSQGHGLFLTWPICNFIIEEYNDVFIVPLIKVIMSSKFLFKQC